MSYLEEKRIKDGLRPFIKFVLVIACIGLLASCGGSGGSATSNNSNFGISQTATTDSALPVTANEARISSGGIAAGREITKTENYNGAKIASNEVLVFSTQISRDALIQVLSKYGYKLVGESSVYQIDVSVDTIDGAIKTLKNEGIKAFPNYTITSQNSTVIDPYASINSPFSWALDSIGLGNAWSLVDGSGNGVRVGIVDGGFRFNHEDVSFDGISSKHWKKNSGSVPDYCVNSVDGTALSDESDACISATHGMHVASIITARSNGTGLAGVAYMNSISPIAYKTDFSDGDTYDGILQLIDQGAKVVNFSMGLNFKNIAFKKVNNPWTADKINDVLSDLRLKYKNNFPDVLIVQSSGNDGNKNYADTGDLITAGDNGYFASISQIDEGLIAQENLIILRQLKSKIIIVGAFDSDKRLASYTQKPKSTADASFILAPGGSAGKTYIDGYLTGLNFPKMVAGAAFKSDAKYARMGGTSQATPHVTGVVALVWMVNSGLSATQVRDIILTHSDTVDGYRALNAEKAVRAALLTLSAPTVSFASSNASPKAGDSITFTPTASSVSGNIIGYDWDFNDPSSPSPGVSMKNGTAVNHIFSTAGTYTVKLTVTDERGKTAVSTKVLVVSPLVVTEGSATLTAAFRSGIYQMNQNNGNNCYFKTSIGAAVATNEYRLNTESYCLNSSKTAWVLNPSSNYASLVMLSDGSWVPDSIQTILINENGASYLKYGNDVYQDLVLTGTEGSLPSGSMAFTFAVSNVVNWYSLFVHSDGYINSHTTDINSLLGNWSYKGGSSLTQGNGQYAWAFDEFLGTAGGPVRFFDKNSGPTCDVSGCTRTILASSAWTRPSLPGGNDGIFIHTPTGISRTEISGQLDIDPFYVVRPGYTGVWEGQMHISLSSSLTDISRRFTNYNRTYFDAMLRGRADALPPTVN